MRAWNALGAVCWTAGDLAYRVNLIGIGDWFWSAGHRAYDRGEA